MKNPFNILALLCLVVAMIFALFGNYDVGTFMLGLAIFNRVGGLEE